MNREGGRHLPTDRDVWPNSSFEKNPSIICNIPCFRGILKNVKSFSIRNKLRSKLFNIHTVLDNPRMDSFEDDRGRTARPERAVAFSVYREFVDAS